MLIDTYVHPLTYSAIYDPERYAMWEKNFGMGLMSPLDYDEIFAEMDICGIKKSFLMPLDLRSTIGETLGSNEEVASICADYPKRFVGFASVDPALPTAAAELEDALSNLGLKGLHLHLGRQRMDADDPRLEALYQVCEKYQVPVYFDAGLSWEPNSLMKYTTPEALEPAIAAHPDINFALAHFAWPKVRECVALLIKYPNVYADTSLLYLGSPKDAMHRLFHEDMHPEDLERSYRDRVMFASNTPRFRAFKLWDAISSEGLSTRALDAVGYKNALSYMKGAISCD